GSNRKEEVMIRHLISLFVSAFLDGNAEKTASWHVRGIPKGCHGNSTSTPPEAVPVRPDGRGMESPQEDHPGPEGRAESTEVCAARDRECHSLQATDGLPVGILAA